MIQHIEILFKHKISEKDADKIKDFVFNLVGDKRIIMTCSHKADISEIIRLEAEIERLKAVKKEKK